MLPNLPSMLKDSEILSAQASILALREQSNLPIELQSELHNIGKTLAADPDYLSQAIKSIVELVKTYPHVPLQIAYESARSELQSHSSQNRMGQDALRRDNTSNSSWTIINMTQEIHMTEEIHQELVSVLSADRTDGQAQSDKSSIFQSIASLGNRLFRKKSQVS
jgi:hypothetical protein